MENRDEARVDSFLDKLYAFSRYYTGYPKQEGPNRVIEFKSERQFLELLHSGYPVVVAFSIKCRHTRHFDKMFHATATEWHPDMKFMNVNCPKYPGFCIARQRQDYPFVEIFFGPKEAENQGPVREGGITRYSVTVLPFNYDVSPYGFREFFKRHGITRSKPEN